MQSAIAHIFIFCLLACALPAQVSFYNFKHLTHEDGLPSKAATEIVEDKYGFIWIGTYRGLVRYDGSTIQVLEKNERDSVFLPGAIIQSLLVSGDSLWIGTQNGLAILNLNSGIISTPTNPTSSAPATVNAASIDERQMIWDISEDRQGNIWLSPSHSGLVKYEKRTNTFRHFPMLPDEQLPNSYNVRDQTTVAQIVQDVYRDSIIWGASAAGIIRLNQATGQIDRILFGRGNERRQFETNRKICIHQTPDGILYTGSWTGGLSIYNPKSKEYLTPTLDFPDRFPAELKGEHLSGILPSDNPMALYLSYGPGLYLFDTGNKRFELLARDRKKGSAPVSFDIDFIDSQKRIWGSSVDGVIVSDPIVHQYRWFSLEDLNEAPGKLIIRALAEDAYPGYVSLSGQYSDGIYHVNTTTGHRFKTPFEEHMARNKYFTSWGMADLGDERLLISAVDQLYMVRRSSDRHETFPAKIPLRFGGLKDCVLDDHNTLWIGSYKDGMFSLNLENRQVTAYKDSFPYPHIHDLFLDDHQNIWMLGSYGHMVYDRQQEKILVFDFNHDSLSTFLVGRNFCQCPNGEIWLSGRADGIGQLSAQRPDQGITWRKTLRDEEGQTVNIHRIACGPENELWAMGDHDLLKIDRQTWTVETFNLAYGVKRWFNNFQFLKDGQLLLGSRDGFYTVDPDRLVRNAIPPIPYVSKVMTNKGSKGRLEDFLHRKPVHLSAGEKVLTIDFSAINHTLAEDITFRFQLEGVDEVWRDPGKERVITYSNLAGGNYVFRIKAANNEGKWNQNAYELPIGIATPWYASTFFRVFLAVALLALLYSIYRERIARLKQENRLRSDFERKVANLEMSALRAQMNPHFIFNCLNSIEAYVIRNDVRKASEYLNTFGRLVRLILQNSRNSFVCLCDELDSLQLYLHLEQMRFKNTFTYEVEVAPDINTDNYEIPPMLIQPFVENAIWHGLNHRDEGGQVKVKLFKKDGNLRCTIKDNGIGREAARKIRAAQKVKRKSMGMGITLDRIDALNKVYNTSNKVQIEDLYDKQDRAAGTLVIIDIAI